jgi:sugar/nucleoside kinase (ribokinase family)
VPAAITGESDVEHALRALRRSHHGHLCVTLGAAGAAMLVGDEFIREPAPRVSAVDTTGAGDVFRAAFIYAMLNGYSPREQLRFANAAAAASCLRAGAIAGVPSRDDVDRLLTRA